jgi:hypothetical protein
MCLLVLCLFISYQGSWKEYLKTLSTWSSMCLFYWFVLKTGYKWECWSYVLKDHINKTEHEMVNLQTDLLIKTRESDAKFLNSVPSAIWPLVKQVTLNANAYFGSACWSETGTSTVKMLSQGTKYIIIKWLYQCGYLRRDEASNIALNSIPLLERIIFLRKQS